MAGFKRRFALFSLFLMSFAHARFLLAQSTELAEIRHSKEFEQFIFRLGERRMRQGGTRNIDLLFGPRRVLEIKNLTTWIGTVTKGFKPFPPMYKAAVDVATVTRPYQVTSTRENVLLTIVVPSPTVSDAAAGGFLDELRMLEPPPEQLVSTEKLNVAQLPATFFIHKNGARSLLFRSPQHAAVLLRSNTKKNEAALFELAEALSIKRMFDKIEY